MMQSLFLIHRLPCPPDGGAKIRAAAQLRYLARRHRVWCAGFVDRPVSHRVRREVQASVAELRSSCQEVAAVQLRPPLARARALSRLLCGGTATEGYFASRVLERQVMRWSREVGFDAVLAFSSSMAPLGQRVAAACRVLEMDDLDSRKWAESADRARWPMTWMYRTEARRLARRERAWLAAFDASVVISEREAALVEDEPLRRRVHVIGPSLPADSERPRGGEGPVCLPAEPVVGFVGAMDYAPNVEGACWFARSIWPHVQARRPDAQWWLVGRSPARAVRRLANGSIRVTGSVPSVEPYFDRMRVSVAPLRLARGVQIKVLMAMAAGRPCVVTPCVAEGVEARAGRDLLVADSPGAFAEAVVDLLTDQRRAEAVGTAGRALVSRRYAADEGHLRLERLLSVARGSRS